MPDIERILEIKKAAQKRLFKIPGVHAVGVGAKSVAGKRTGEVSITVFVDEKKPLSEIAPEDRIPSEIEGVRTDVVQRGRVKRASGGPDKKPHRPLLGGIRIQPGGVLGGGGTLGCIAHTTDSPPKIVGVTCHHVVAEPPTSNTNVTITEVDFQTINIAVGGSRGTPNTRISLEIDISPGGTTLHRAAYYMVGAAEKDTDIADNIKKAIDAAAISGVTVSVTGTAVKVDGVSGKIKTTVLGPDKEDSKTKLHVSITSTDASTHLIKFSGESKNGYGVYVEIDPGGANASFGGFTGVDEHFALSGVASAVASFLQGIVGASGVTVSAPLGANTITVSKAEAVRCNVSRDTRVGQPDNRFGCSTSWCTNNRIGRVYKSRRDVDTALILLDAGLKYLAQIEEIGVVGGFYAVQDSEVHPGGPGDPPIQYSVKKRGADTGLTPAPGDGCAISHLHLDGFGDSGDFYQEGMLIVSGNDVADHGDSGSALVSDQPPNDGKIVGIIYGITPNLLGSNDALATPIQLVTVAMGIDMEVATAAQKDVARTVPKIAGVNMAMLDDDEREGSSVAGRASAAVRDRLMEVGNEISATPLGQDYAETVRRHIPEVQDLINKNNRVGAIWRRYGGNQIVASFLELVQYTERTLPGKIDERPIAVCLRKIEKALLRYGSAALGEDLKRLGPLFMESIGLTYAQMLSRLEAAGTE